MGILSRWLPVGASAAYVLFVLTNPPQGPEYARHVGATLAFPLLWLAVALWAAATGRYRLLAANLKRAGASGVVAMVGAVTVLAVLAHFVYASPSWVPLFLLVLHISLAGEQPRMRFAALAAGLVVAMLTVESFVLILRHTPSYEWPERLTSLSARLYQQDWRIIQYDRECSRYDPELFYTLLPGTCVLENVEFTNTYYINRLGVRDDEKSLDAPEIVVAGDSHAMGLGVEQDETFAQRLEEITGRRVLNMSVSSYAPPRELTMLERVDRSRLRYLLIQLCANDAVENVEFVTQGELPRHPPDLHDDLVARFERARRYYPGRYATWVLSDTLRGVFEAAGLLPARPQPPPPLEPREETGVLLDVLENHPVDLSGVEILLYEINEGGGYREWLVPMLREMLAERTGRRHMDQIRVVKVRTVFDDDDFFQVDGHMRPSGHEKIARRLAEFID